MDTKNNNLVALSEADCDRIAQKVVEELRSRGYQLLVPIC